MNFYILVFLTAFFSSMLVLTAIQIVHGQSIKDLDNECRENYHPYCFGERWNSLVEDYCDGTEYPNDEYCDYSDTDNYLDPVVQTEKPQINEDQIVACNFEDKCVTIDIDDYMNKQKSDLLWSQFNNDIDTYSMEDLS